VAIDLSIEIALLLERWQGIVNMMAQVAEVPCVLINRLDKNEIVFRQLAVCRNQLFIAMNLFHWH
jgi:hypothetical protein